MFNVKQLVVVFIVSKQKRPADAGLFCLRLLDYLNVIAFVCMLSITIEDNDIGLANDIQQKDGIGLKSLQSRVKAMNGKIELDSIAGQGLNAYLEFETAALEKVQEVSLA